MPALQDLHGPYAPAAAACGASLGERADDYSTALSADDLAAVVTALGLAPVDVYGDSYGTFFAQVYAGRHPEQVRSVVLDGAYPAYGEDGWYRTQGSTMRAAFTAVCERSPTCRQAGRPFLPTLSAVLDAVRDKPWRGVAFDADGRRMTGPRRRLHAHHRGLRRDVRAGVLPRAHRRAPLRARRRPQAAAAAGRRGHRRRHRRRPGPRVQRGAGRRRRLPRLPAALRHDRLAAGAGRAVRRRAGHRPAYYAPFTAQEYADSDWQSLDWCTQWPSAPATNPAGPPVPPSGSYSDVPVLVLSGELDSITTAAEGDLVAGQFPNARHVVVANSFHVTAIGDTDDCAVGIVRAFVRSRPPGSARLRRRGRAGPRARPLPDLGP